jgi:hypothetical protein
MAGNNVFYIADGVRAGVGVTCENCKWHHETDFFGRAYMVCENRSGLYTTVDPHDYCSRGTPQEAQDAD